MNALRIILSEKCILFQKHLIILVKNKQQSQNFHKMYEEQLDNFYYHYLFA